MNRNFRAFVEGMLNAVGLFVPLQSPIKRYSFTSTSANIGVNDKLDFIPGAKDFITGKTKVITNDLLNLIIATKYSNIKPIEPSFYRLNNLLVDSLCLTIEHVDPIVDKDTNELKDIRLTLKDTSHNLTLTMNVSVEEFHELFNIVNTEHISHPPKKE